MKNPYEVLDIPVDATQEDIKRAHRTLALRYHPDKAGPEGEEKFKEVQDAYDLLSDPEKRKQYDRFGDLSEAVPDVMASHVARLFSALFGFVITSLILVFMAFISAYTDDKLTSWNWKKVFSPLFAIDGLLLPVLLLALLSICSSFRGLCFAICLSCAIILTILIPVCKDKNEDRNHDYLLWRVWLIPGYIFSAFAVFLAFSLFSSLLRRGIVHSIIFLMRMIGVLAIPLFFAFMPCRADEKTTWNYFIVIGLPVYIFFGMPLLCKFFEVLVVGAGFLGLCKVLLGSIFFNAPLAACVISASLISKRMNYGYTHGSYSGTYSVASALIPMFILVGFILVGFVIAFIIELRDPPAPKPTEDEPDVQQNNNNNSNNNNNYQRDERRENDYEVRPQPAAPSNHASDID